MITDDSKKDTAMKSVSHLDHIAAEDYKSLNDAMEESKEVRIIDLMRFNFSIRDCYEECLLPEPNAIWIKGRLDPIVNFDRGDKCYSYGRVLGLLKDQAFAPPDITSFGQFIECTEPVCSESGTFIVPFSPCSRKSLFQQECSFDRIAIYNAFVVAHGFFSRLHPATHVTVSKRLVERLDMGTYVRKQNLYPHVENGEVEFNEEDQPGIDQLLHELNDFVGRDRFCLYHLEMKNTELHIHKGNDYRVIEYYRNVFERLEAYEEEHNGILKILR
jgi:hypothetical protein